MLQGLLALVGLTLLLLVYAAVRAINTKPVNSGAPIVWLRYELLNWALGTCYWTSTRRFAQPISSEFLPELATTATLVSGPLYNLHLVCERCVR